MQIGRKKIRFQKIYPERDRSTDWSRWFLDIGRGFFIWDEPERKGKFICGAGSFSFGEERVKLIERIKKDGSTVFGNKIREKILLQ